MTGFRYRSLAGDVYDANVTAHRGSFVDVEAIFPSGRRIELRSVPFLATDTGARGACFKREDHDDGQK